jgi:hypothetical protein
MTTIEFAKYRLYRTCIRNCLDPCNNSFRKHIIEQFDVLLLFFFPPYSRIFQLYDGGQFLLVKERTQIHHTMYFGRDHRPSANSHTVTSVRAGFEPTRAGGERHCGMRPMS